MKPIVMGILNCTPDSFYEGSRMQTEYEIEARAEQIISEGGSIIDVGAYSTRPGATEVSQDEEMRRLRMALTAIRRGHSKATLSVDTFRAEVAQMAVEEFGVDIINDVGTPTTTHHPSPNTHHLTPMQRMVTGLQVPYIYMSRKATMRDILLDSAEVMDTLRAMGQKDIILDPGFGFGKTLEENYDVLNNLERMQMTGLPVLVGVSRKSMIYKRLDIDPAQALNGTTVLNTIALAKGASILRVHDVREAVEAVKLSNCKYTQ
jgi:dihydropteroate synthase